MTFYFYDLETSGFNPREARVMQFGGQRTDMELNPVGKPHNFLIKMADDVLPGPEAILVTGITPQKTKAEGITEAEFLHIFTNGIATPGTIFIGFNSVRFDDEFMRYMHYRNFYDPYEWQWQDGRSKWDLLDLTRMARALRPEGIKWPVDSEGKPANRLELLAAINKLEHTNAHDALSDVLVTIDLARLIKNKQPKLFEHLLKIRGKKEVAQLVHSNSMFVYTSGKYPSEFEKTTVVTVLAGHPTTEAAIVYDLRQGPEPFIKMAPEQLAEAWQWHPPEENYPKLPIKTIKFNRCPAVAPLSVLDSASQKRLGIDMKAVNANLDKLINFKGFVPKVLKAVEILDGQQQAGLLEKEQTVDTQLYDGFFGGQDKLAMRAVRAAQPQELADFSNKLADNRLKALLPLYQARNYPESLNIEQRAWWENYCHNKFTSGGGKSRLAQYFERLETIKQGKLNKQQQYLVTELELYGQSLM